MSHIVVGQTCHLLWRIQSDPWWDLVALAFLNAIYVAFILPESRWLLEARNADAKAKEWNNNPLAYFRLLHSSSAAGPVGSRLLRYVMGVGGFIYLMKFAVIHIVPLYAMEVLAWGAGDATWLSTTYSLSQLVVMCSIPVILRFWPDIRVMTWI